MKYIVLEIQSGETVGTLTTVFDNLYEAESKFFDILHYAAVSNIPIHSAVLLNDEGYHIRYECYKHPSEE